MSAFEGLPRLPSPVLRRGRQIALRIFSALRVVRGHGLGNAASKHAIDRLAREVQDVLKEASGPFELRFQEDILLLNGAVVPPSTRGRDQISELARLLLEKDVGGVRFVTSPSRALLEEWCSVLTQTAQSDGDLERIWRVLDGIEPRGIQTYRPKSLARDGLPIVRLSSESFAVAAFARAIVAFREVVRHLEARRDPLLGKLSLVRVVQDLVDVACQHPALLREVAHRGATSVSPGRTALTSELRRGISVSKDDLPRHAAGICAIALLIGVEAGLTRLELLDLGTGALLSKVGFALLPEDRPGTSKREEQDVLRRGAMRAFQGLVRKSWLLDMMVRSFIVANEHVLTGVPPRSLHPYSRVVVVADAYHALISDCLGEAMSSQEALHRLRAGEGQRPLDGEVIDLLIRVLGGRSYLQNEARLEREPAAK